MKNVDADRMDRTYGNMPVDLMDLRLLLLKPALFTIDNYVGFLENVDNKSFVENFVCMEMR